jgi:WD40 repeat protein
MANTDQDLQAEEEEAGGNSKECITKGSTCVETKGYTCVETLEGTHTKTVRCCEFSQCDTMIASVSFDATTCLWDRSPAGEEAIAHEGSGWDLLVTLEGHESEIKDVRWSPDGELLATCGRDKSIWVWLKELDEQFECVDVLQGHTQDIKAITWIPFTRAIVSASYDNTLKVWNEISDEWVCTQTLDSCYQGHENTVWDLCCDTEGKRLLSCDASGMILLWKVEHADQKYELSLVSRNKVPSEMPVYSIDWSPSGLIATGLADNSISLLQVETEAEEEEEEKREILKLVQEVKRAHVGDVNCVRFNPKHPHLLASGSDDESIKVWNLRDLINMATK